MDIDSTAAPTTKRIAGTLHTRGYTHPAPLRDEEAPKEKADESEVARRYKNNGQQGHKRAG